MATKKTVTTKNTKKAESVVKASTKKPSVKTTAVDVSVKKPSTKLKAKSASRKKTADAIDVEEVETTTASTITLPSMPKIAVGRKTIAAVAVLVILGGLLYLAGKYAVIAWVDNRPVTRFQLYSNLENRYGKDMTEQLIVENLILSESRQKNLTATDAEVDAEIKKIEVQQGGADQLNQILQVQGIGQTEFRNLIKLQLLRTKIFSEGITVTDEQVAQYIEQNKDNIPAASEGASPQDKETLKKDVKEQLLQEQVSQKFNEWLRTNLQSDRVKRAS